MSDKPLLQSGSGRLRVGRLGRRDDERRTHTRVKCLTNALGTPLALGCPVRTKETR
jgi:hypothetical protein